MRMPIKMTYIDFIDAGRSDASGFRGGGPARYKVDTPLFERHLDAISRSDRSPTSVLDSVVSQAAAARDTQPLFLTFDDGGASAFWVGKALRDAGWIGHFFVTTDYIGTPGFLDVAGIRGLARMGHVIGSHSSSHPVPMTPVPSDELFE